MTTLTLSQRSVEVVLKDYLGDGDDLDLSSDVLLYDDLGFDSLDLAACLNDLEQVLEVRIEVKTLLACVGVKKPQLTVGHLVDYASTLLKR